MTTMHRTGSCIVKVYGSEHGIPHYHLLTPSGRAVVSIADGTVLAGTAPRKALAEAQTWSAKHSAELLAEWRRLNPTL
jgi:hypothetical protein